VLILVSYDIPDDRRRLRLANVLEDFGERVQYSVFECHLEAGPLDRLRLRLLQELDEAQDSVRIYRVCAACEDELEMLGTAEPTSDPKVYVF
jgi:CRISPR-associated protein Cas2